MPRPFPPYDSWPPDAGEGEFFRESLLAELDGCDCDNAEFLRAIAIPGDGEEDNEGNLGSLIELSYAAVCSLQKRSHKELKSGFSKDRFHRFFRGSSASGMPLPRHELIRHLVKYMSKNPETEELVRERSQDELDCGTLELGQHSGIVIGYRWDPNAFQP